MVHFQVNHVNFQGVYVGLEAVFPFGKTPIFRGELLVSGRVYST